MRRLLLPALLICAIMLACTFSGGKGTATPGNQGNSLLNSPLVGLDNLENYTASLTVSFKGTQTGQAIDQTDSYLQTEWPKLPAQFTSIHTRDDSGAPQVILSGAVGDAQYYQADPASPCTVDWGAAASGPADFQPASLLPVVGAAKLADEQTLDGVATKHYTFDAASLGLPSDATASGETWIAKTGGYVMKYVLDITGTDSVFGTGISGTRHMEYALSEVGAHAQVVYPAGCEPVLSDVPAMDDATDLVRLPGLLAYSTSSSAADIFAFYEDKLTAMGWQKSADNGIGSDSATTTFNRSDSNVGVTVAVDTEAGLQQVIVMIPVQGSATATTGADTTPGAASVLPSTRAALAMTILLGMRPSQPAPASFHLEVINQAPAWDGTKIAQSQDAMSADVQGKDVHYTESKTPPGGSAKTSEAYLISGQEYDVVNGKVGPAGADSKTWTLWPLNLELMLATGAPGATAAGTETLEGRTAEVYELAGTGSGLSGSSGMALPIASVSGKIWVDQQTGALLKAVLDYQAEVTDSSGNDQGSGSGHVEITVTQVGNVSVALP